MYLIDAYVFNSDLYATYQVAKYNRFPSYLAKNFNFKVKGNIHYIVDNYANKNIKIKTCRIEPMSHCTNP